MTATTDLTAQIAAYRKVLAEATKECPAALHTDMESLEVACGACGIQGDAGRIARFPEFRQVCENQEYHLRLGGSLPCREDCFKCSGTGWQVHAGGLEDALAGLTRAQAWRFFVNFPSAFEIWHAPVTQQVGPMPSAPEILAEGLRLVIEITGLEVPDEAL